MAILRGMPRAHSPKREVVMPMLPTCSHVAAMVSSSTRACGSTAAPSRVVDATMRCLPCCQEGALSAMERRKHGSMLPGTRCLAISAAPG